MRRAGLLAIVLGAGCSFDKPPNLTGGSVDAADPDGGGNIDAPPPTACMGHMFSGFTELMEFSQDAFSEPSITGDMRELFFSYETGSPPQYEIFHATRAGETGPFSNFAKVSLTAPFSSPRVDAQDPSITADGALLVFRFDAGMGVRAHASTRSGTTWSTPALLLGLEEEELSSLDISWDGLTLYFHSGGSLQYATRASRGENFVIKGFIGGDLRFPAVSSDGLELYYSDNDVINRRARMTATETFAPPTTMHGAAYDPDLSADGTTLFVSKPNLRGILMATRPCE